MAYLFCAITKEIPINPVFSPSTNLIYDKSALIYFKNQNKIKCPITDKEFFIDELIQINSHTTLKPSESIEINQKFKILYDNFNYIMKKKQNLIEEKVERKKELSYSLYRKEACLKVVAKLQKEIDFLNSKLKNLQNMYSESNNDQQIGINKEIIDYLAELAKDASSKRKERRSKQKKLQ